MSYEVSTIENNSNQISTRGEDKSRVSAHIAPPKEVQNKEESVPKLSLRELDVALSTAVKNTRFSYRINDNIDMIIVKIIDRDTDEVIKEIPGEEIQKLHENLQQAIGLLFDREI